MVILREEVCEVMLNVSPCLMYVSRPLRSMM